jgi:ribonuclease-3
VNKRDRLQKNLGYKFQDHGLLEQALTHRSLCAKNNERLEYLGDSILGFFVADRLYHRYPDESEGNLTRMRARLVRRETISEIARNLDLQSNLLMGGGELKSGGYNRGSVLADAFESIIGAVYIDSGIESVTAMLDHIYRQSLETIQPSGMKDSKTMLQELLQKKSLSLPQYRVTGEEGEDHDLVFTVCCHISDLDQEFEGIGKSRKVAEQIAAASAIEEITNSGN